MTAAAVNSALGERTLDASIGVTAPANPSVNLLL